MSVYIAHGISRCECLLRSHNWNDLEACARLRPLRIPESQLTTMIQENDSSGTRLIAALTNSACDLHITKISWTPARARLSNVQSSNGALHIGRRH
jgi:hypothetical protein